MAGLPEATIQDRLWSDNPMSSAPWLLLLVAACNTHPPQVLGPPVVGPRARRPDDHQALVGLMCPAGAQGRPLLVALAARLDAGWVGDPAGLATALAGGRTLDVSVLSFNGHHAGRFAAVGPADVGLGTPTALGAYAGALPCADEATATECAVVLHDCGLALSDEATLTAAGACAAGGRLVVATERGGALEAFALDDLARLPDEITAAAVTGATPCPPRFAFAAGGGVYVVGVADLDGDGRIELVIARREPTGGRRVAVYTAATALRLERIAEVALPQ